MSTDSNKSENRDPSSKTSTERIVASLRWPVALVVVATIGYFSFYRACETVETQKDLPVQAAQEARKIVSSIAEKFKTGKITTSFVAALPRMAPDDATRLELASFEATETFRKTDEKRIVFNMISLGTNVTEIRVPATYRYHVLLKDKWHMQVVGQHCIVKAPKLRATVPIAIHTDKLETLSTRGWLRLDGEKQLATLHKSITPTLNKRASEPETINLIRETARRRLAEFVRNWLLVEDHWREDRFRTITVIFDDEKNIDERAIAPTVIYENYSPSTQGAPEEMRTLE